MKQIPEALAAHLAGRATTLARVWLVTRADGVRLGFTDHDRSLSVDGVTCQPQEGLEASLDQSGPDLAVGGGEVSGALSTSGLRDVDLELGLWDGAEVAIWQVNWADVTQALLLRRARIGEVSRKGQAFTAELRSLSHALDVAKGRVFSNQCDADLGDARCGIDLSDPAYHASPLVVAMSDPSQLSVSGLEGFESGWFSGGVLKVLDGDFADFHTEIADHRVSPLTGQVDLALWQAPPGLVAPGTGLHVTAGCDRCLATCSEKFSNHLNFRGFPHMPGNDFVLSYPQRNSGENDGSPLRG
ncbi:DUF2163 domain-containing protein [Roseibium sp.]|uniref:DUF2163 domain-containing protein n=1 Tax=Roseibium sp. TaxID=1936156 RepID=UPI003A9748DA